MSEEGVKTELALAKPAEMMRLATDVAGVCEKIVQNTAINIKGKRYVKVEGWQSIATAHGCVAGARDVERIDRGVRAIGEIRRIDNGIVIATAEGYVGDDEKTWKDRDEYAKRAMAQTRAISRACRSAFAHVVVLIDKDLSTTPAEEVPYGGFEDNHSKVTVEPKGAFQKAKKAMSPEEEERDARVAAAVAAGKTTYPPKRFGDWRDCIMHFSKHAGKQLGELSNQQLSWYREVWMPKKKADKDWPVTDKDQNLFDALDSWHMEVEEKRKAFEARQKEEPEDTIPMDYPTTEEPY